MALSGATYCENRIRSRGEYRRKENDALTDPAPALRRSGAGIRFDIGGSSTDEENRAIPWRSHMRYYALRYEGHSESKDKEPLKEPILKSKFRRRSCGRSLGRRPSSFSSDNLDIEENPRRRQVPLTPPRYEWTDSSYPVSDRSTGKQMAIKPPTLNGNGSALTFDNCAEFNRWSDREKFHCLNALDFPAAQILWDLQSSGVVSYRRLRAMLKQVYWSHG